MMDLIGGPRVLGGFEVEAGPKEPTLRPGQVYVEKGSRVLHAIIDPCSGSWRGHYYDTVATSPENDDPEFGPIPERRLNFKISRKRFRQLCPKSCREYEEHMGNSLLPGWKPEH